MAMACTVCASPHRDAVDAAVMRGETAVSISVLTGLHESAIRRHGRNHAGGRLGIAHLADDLTADDLVGRLAGSLSAVGVVLSQASERNNASTTLAASREQRALIAQLAETFGIDAESTADRQAAQGQFFRALASVGKAEPDVVRSLSDAIARRGLDGMADAVREFAAPLPVPVSA